MTIFYIGLAILLLLALLFILWPLFSHYLLPIELVDYSSIDSRQSTNITVYQDHLADINQSLLSGNLTQSQYDVLKIELARNLSQEIPSSIKNSNIVRVNTCNKGLLISVSIFVFILAIAIYTQLGTYTTWSIQTIIKERSKLQKQYIVTIDPSVRFQMQSTFTELNQQLALKLKTYIKNSPENLTIRILLARIMMHLGNYPLAIKHFQFILKEEPRLTAIMAELAQATFLQANNRVLPIVRSLVDKILKLDSNNTIALGLAGIGAFQSEKYLEAIAFWKKATQAQGATSDNTLLEDAITAAKRHLELKQSKQGQIFPESTQSTPIAEKSTISVSASFTEGINVSPKSRKNPLSLIRLQISELPTTLILDYGMYDT